MLKPGVFNRYIIHEADSLVHRGLGIRFMTCEAVHSRCAKKRVEDLEVVAEKHKVVSKFITLFDILKKERQYIIQVRNLEKYRGQIHIRKPHKISDFLRKVPMLFELYRDPLGRLWCGLTPTAESLMKEERKILNENNHKAAEYVTRMLMMSVDKRILVDKITACRRELGLPKNYKRKWMNKYPELFKVVRPFAPRDERLYLELVSWRPEWAITELEKKQMGIGNEYDCKNHVPGLLSLAFPMKFPREYKKTLFRRRAKIKLFQKTEYLSPYAEAKDLIPGSLEFNKRALAIMHELLSFTVEKRLVTDQFTFFRREFVMPQKLMRFFLKYLGIFYVATRGKRLSVFLNEAYKGTQLIENHPLVIWREKVLRVIGYRGKKKKFKTYNDWQDEENTDFIGSEPKDDNGVVETEGEDNCTSKFEGEAALAENTDFIGSEPKDDNGVVETEAEDNCMSKFEGEAAFAENTDFIGTEPKDDKVETEGEDNCMSKFEGEAAFADDSEMEIDENHMADKNQS